MTALYITGFFILLIAFILARAALFLPKKQEETEQGEVSYDGDAAVAALAELIKCRTVSYYDGALEDDGEFEKLIAKLPELYPDAVRTCPMERLPDRALLFKWAGKQEGDASVLMAHYDVVPVEESDWEKPPFDAVIEDGVMWGRGTLDTKVTLNGILSAANELIKQGFQPEHDVYFAFSGGEEVNGQGAAHIVQRFQENGVKPAMVLDEGGGVVENVFPGVTRPCGLIGIAEKGTMNLRLSFAGEGGHASAPEPHTPVGRLAMACVRAEAHPFRAHITRPAREMFNVLGRYSSFGYRVIFANLWCFGWVLDLICKRSGGELNALLRTTAAFTQMEGSAAPNVIPAEASMVANLRLNPKDSVEEATDYIRRVIRDDAIKLDDLNSMEPSPISRTDGIGWERVVSAVRGTWRDALVAPYLMVACSDSRHYRDLSDRVYRFSAMALTAEERRTIHGSNERITLAAAKKAVEFFMRVLTQC